MARLKEYYQQNVISEMMKGFEYTNVMEVPKLSKILVNMGLGEAIHNIKVLESAQEELALITGQRPIVPQKTSE